MMWLPDEEWADIPGYVGMYWVSTEGRVLSGRRKNARGRVLKPTPDGNGYAQVTLAAGRQRTIWPKIHDLVASAFLGSRPSGMEICHRDGDRMNPELRNIRYGTRWHNMQDMLAHGMSHWANKTHCPAGHEYVPENTGHQNDRPGQPHRYCKTCKRLKKRAYDQRRKLAA